MYHAICESILRELDKLEDKYASGAQITGQDVKDIDLMAHALKCLKTYEAMADYDGGRSRRSTGRYREEDTREYRRY